MEFTRSEAEMLVTCLEIAKTICEDDQKQMVDNLQDRFLTYNLAK